MRRIVFRLVVCGASWLAADAVLAQEPADGDSAPRPRIRTSLNIRGVDTRVTTPRKRVESAAKELGSIVRRAERSVIGRIDGPPGEDDLTRFGAMPPFDFTPRGKYLVAAERDGRGLALWETSRRAPQRQLAQSNHIYLLIAISDDARWIAGLRGANWDLIDVWRVDTGKHVRTLDVAPGKKIDLDFHDGDHLHVVTLDHAIYRCEVPDGALTLTREANGAGGARAPQLTFDNDEPAAMNAPPIAPAPPAMAAPPRRPRTPVDEPPDEPEADDDGGPSFGHPAPAPDEAGESFDDVPEATVLPPSRPRMPAPQMAAPSMAAPPHGSVIVGSPRLAVEEAGEAAPQESAEEAFDFGPAMAAPGASEESEESFVPAPAAAAPAEPSGGSAPPAAAEKGDAETAETGAAQETTAHEFRLDVDEPAAAAPAAPLTAKSDSAKSGPAKQLTQVTVHYATNRNKLTAQDLTWLACFFNFLGSLPAFVVYVVVAASLLVLPWIGRRSWGAVSVAVGIVLIVAMGSVDASVRSQLGVDVPDDLYGAQATDLSYGTCVVSAPPEGSRRPGELSRPLSFWVFELPENPDRHFVLRHVEEHHDKDDFYESLSARLAQSDSQAALLFIHGYNVSFEDAIFRTAQLAVDLKFDGAPVSFSWPSYANPLKYTFDEQQAEVSVPALREVLDDLANRSGAKRVHIIAHSMGNRVLAGALRSMDSLAQARNRQVFRELVMAAPDVDTRVFQNQFLPHIERSVQHCTLYASSRDRALLMSRCFHNYQRLGEAEPELVVATGLETIDATLVDTSLLGHSYIGDAKSIVEDLHELLVLGQQAAERAGLTQLERNALKYWTIKPEIQTAAGTVLRR